LTLVFAVVAVASAPDAVAQKQRRHNFVAETPPSSKQNNYNYLRRHCLNEIKETPGHWTWDDALLIARFSKKEDGTSLKEKFLDAKNIDIRLPLASITKSMTAYLVFEAIKDKQLSLFQRIPVLPDSLCLGDSAFAIDKLPKNIMDSGITVSDALTHTLRLSSNPMAYNLAVAVAGSEAKFVERMNKTAKDWGMNDTHFMNPHGLPVGDRKGEHTTARDLLKMAEHIIPDFDLYQTYSHANLMVDTSPYYEKKNEIKEYLRNIGAVAKTGTINQCKSLFTIAEDGDDKIVSIQLCTKQNRMTQIKEIMKSVLGIRDVGVSP
jgi:D-alanyl-D-alanine carboxypeptidase (penicillin-binding protein 5/6)